MKYIIVAIFLVAFVFSHLSAQETYVPVVIDTEAKKEIIQELETRYKKDIKTISGDLSKETKEAYEKRFEKLAEKIESERFLLNNEIQAYMDEILAHIVSVNPSLQQEQYRVLISRDGWPNASCYGEGTIAINLGLLNRLDNESQLAFVICHELAHQTLDHVNKAIDERVEKLYGKQTKAELKKISKSEYNRYEKTMALLKDLTIDTRRHSRLFESEADAQAIVFLEPTRYNEKEAVTCLDILDNVDKGFRSDSVDYRQLLETPTFKFRDRWLEGSSNSFIYASETKAGKKLQDSLKTHPDCQERIKKIIPLVDHTTKADDQQDFSEIRRLADFEIVEAHYRFANFGKALFQSIQLLKDYPDDGYLHSVIVECFYELYQHQKRHELGLVLEMPDKRREKNYNQFLEFIHNLRLRDLAKLGYHYSIKNGDAVNDYEDFRYVQLFAASTCLKEEAWKKLKMQYLSDFADGTYSQEIKDFKPSFE